MVYKPAGVPTTPGEEPNSLVEQVLKEFPEQKKVKCFNEGEGGLLYRLDTITSGVALFACTDKAFKTFIDASQRDEVEKIYRTEVDGKLRYKEGEITYAIAHHPRSKSRMTVRKHGGEAKRGEWRQAITAYRVIEEKKDSSLLEVMITKGARHQIRVHLEAIGHPLCNDPLYGTAFTNRPFFLECHEVYWQNNNLHFSVDEILENKSA